MIIPVINFFKYKKNKHIYFFEYFLTLILFTIFLFTLKHYLSFINDIYKILNFYILFALSIALSFKLKFDFFGKEKTTFTYPLIIIIINILLNYNNYPWTIGGQDQGVYINHAKKLSKNFSISNKDEFINNNIEFPINNVNEAKIFIEKNESYLEKYFKINKIISGTQFHETIGSKLEKQKNKSILFNRSVSKRNFDEKLYDMPYENRIVFHGYTPFPIYLSFFLKIFDDLNFSKYGMLTLSSLISLLFFFIALKISKSSKFSFFSTLLITTNPVINFFFKFPASEILRLLFFLLFYLLIVDIFRNQKFNKKNIILVSVLFFLICLSTHANFLYLCLIFLIVIALENKNIKHIASITSVLSIIFILSNIILIFFHNDYSSGHYVFLENRFGVSWLVFIITPIFILLLMILFKINLIKINVFFSYCSDLIFKNLRKISIIFILLIFIISLTLSYSFNSDFFPHNNLFLHYLKYFFPFLLIMYINKSKYTEKNINLINLSFLLIFSSIFIQRHINYEFYFLRYLVPELIPLLFLFFISNWKNLKFKKINYILFSTFIILGLTLSFLQSFKTETLDSYYHVKDLGRKYSNKNTALIFVPPKKKSDLFIQNRLTLPLKYFENVNLFNSKNISAKDIGNSIEFLSPFFKNIYLFSKDELNDDFYELINKSTYPETFLEHSYKIHKYPIKFKRHLHSYFIYKLNKEKFYNYYNKKELLVQNDNHFFEVSGMYNFTGWTKNKLKIKILNARINKINKIEIDFFPILPNKMKKKSLIKNLTINNKQSDKYNLDFENNKLILDTSEISNLYEISINFTTFKFKDYSKPFTIEKEVGLPISLIRAYL